MAWPLRSRAAAVESYSATARGRRWLTVGPGYQRERAMAWLARPVGVEDGPARQLGRRGENKGRERPRKGESQMKKNFGPEARLSQFFSNLIFLILFQMGFKSI